MCGGKASSRGIQVVNNKTNGSMIFLHAGWFAWTIHIPAPVGLHRDLVNHSQLSASSWHMLALLHFASWQRRTGLRPFSCVSSNPETSRLVINHQWRRVKNIFPAVVLNPEAFRLGLRAWLGMGMNQTTNQKFKWTRPVHGALICILATHLAHKPPTNQSSFRSFG